ncbi:MAG: hypothetical protein IJF88_08390 [Oscillospiraceae bacterium]|nr:hypothetical protein [Oscillospiraceae bacterium]MBQ2634577.1 hypothetical protein [Oscillospiraceae bacterium]MBR3084002.1 hypothetical protein [Oscillospiraceae bacterium]MBR3860757.1 hypothetical protein [Oscillospiraceae bacterium]MBR6097039.1 hypothetical protein [Oscillospiraceae bacterium]
MDMITIPVTIPRGMAPYLDWKEQDISLEQRALLLYPLIRRLVISHGRAAELLGIRKMELIELYDAIGIPYLCQSRKELDEELGEFSKLRELRAV